MTGDHQEFRDQVQRAFAEAEKQPDDLDDGGQLITCPMCASQIHVVIDHGRVEAIPQV